MNSKNTRRLLAGAAVAAACSGAQAAVLFQQLPQEQAVPDGVQSDAGTPGPYTQSFTVPAGAVLDRIVWWGLVGDSVPGAADHFEVTIGNVLMGGSLTSQVDGLAIRYTLDVVDAPIDSGTLGIWNNTDQLTWYWHAAATAALPANTLGFGPTAFVLEGSTRLPEPPPFGLLASAGVAAAALAAIARRRRG